MFKTNLGLLCCGLVVVCVASCSESRRAGQCDDVIAPCSELGNLRCSSDLTAIETCGSDADGCLMWTESESCGSGLCDASGPTPECTGDVCVDECDTTGETRCSGRTIESCETGADGCRDWVLDEDCGAADQGCSEASGTPECVEGCGDECAPHDAEQCNGTRIEHCDEDAAGCWLWAEDEDCADAGETCDDSGGTVECVGGCEDLCDAAGDSQCDGQVIQTCETDADGCLDWVDGRNCEDDSLFCDDSSGTAECSDTCSDECGTEGVTQCDGDTIQSCETGAGGCLYWVDGEDCSATGAACEESSTGAACTGACTDECATADETRCLGNLLQTCETGSAGCLTWADTTDCETLGESCVVAGGDASCLCIDECSLGESQCVGDMVQSCEDVMGCLRWVDIADCSALGLPCADTSGTAECVTGDGDDCTDAMDVWAFPFSHAGADFGGDFDDDLTFTHSSCLSRPGEPEAVFAVTVDADATIHMYEYDAIDVTISVQTACDPAGPCELAEDDFSGGLEYDVPAAGTYYVIVEESYRGGDPYDIYINVTYPEDCGDGVDNDGDGDIDCADDDCFGDPTHCATETLCSDGADNDADGDTDCDDADCAGVLPDCAPQQGIFEIFGGGGDPVDLRGTSIVFTPDAAAADGYTWTTSSITDFPVIPGDGTVSTPLALGDDDSEEYTFATMPDFDFYGTTYTSMFVSSNGYITFDVGENDYTPSELDFFEHPVISALWTDLNPAAAGTVTVDDSADQVVVTFDGVPRYGAGSLATNNFQIILNSDGSIEIAIVTVASRSAGTATGIADGIGSAAFPPETDFVVIPPETDCTDGVDNDFDGDTDCDDTDCAADPTCYESDCDDGVDNDGDGDTDCWDDECLGDPACEPHGYWEDYPGGTPDIEGHTITFTPDASDPIGYTWAATTLMGVAYPVAPGTGTTTVDLSLGDDDFEEYTLAHMADFTFFDVDHTSFFVSSNGYITFGTGSDSYGRSPAAHFEFPCISLIRTDLDPRARGTITVDEFADRVVVTFDGIVLFGGGGSVAANDVQIILNDDGSIELHYLNISVSGMVAGISSGVGDGAFPPETNFVP